MMEDEAVVPRKWLTHERFLDLLEQRGFLLACHPLERLVQRE
jgi:hypothetical protein